MLGQIHQNKEDEYDYYIDSIMKVIGQSGDNVNSYSMQRESLEHNRYQTAMGSLTEDDRRRKTSLYLLVGIVSLVILVIGGIILFKK